MKVNRPSLRQAIQQEMHTENAGESQGNIVTRYVLVVESMDASGSRWLGRIDGDAADQRLVQWDRRGLLHEALAESNWED